MRRLLAPTVALIAAAALLAGLFMLRAAAEGIETRERSVGAIPVTTFSTAEGDGPLVVIAHGFSGSRQMVRALALTLAKAGYRVATLDLPGHGDNPVPMSSQITQIQGATRQLQAAIAEVIDAELERLGGDDPVALVGHSMATDLIIRQAIGDARVGPVVAISMYSDAVSATAPARMLAISGSNAPEIGPSGASIFRDHAPNAG